jgi:hypothetical protein
MGKSFTIAKEIEMPFHSSRYEQMTALTDMLLGVLSIYVIMELRQFSGFKPGIWIAAFVLLAIASFLGMVAHGFEMSKSLNWWLWQPLNLSLGLALGLFMAGALYDLFGESVTRTALPFLIGAGVVFYGITVAIPGTFLTFIAYEAIAMLFALGAYIWLTVTGTLPGAGWMIAGVLVTIVAAVVQATGTAGKSIFWYFDNNGVFHLIQLPGIWLLLMGLKASLKL